MELHPEHHHLLMELPQMEEVVTVLLHLRLHMVHLPLESHHSHMEHQEVVLEMGADLLQVVMVCLQHHLLHTEHLLAEETDTVTEVLVVIALVDPQHLLVVMELQWPHHHHLMAHHPTVEVVMVDTAVVAREDIHLVVDRLLLVAMEHPLHLMGLHPHPHPLPMELHLVDQLVMEDLEATVL